MQRQTACELAGRIRRRDLSASEVVEQHLSAIERHQPRLNAFVELRAEAAREEARLIDARGPSRPLDGVPMSVKSSIQVAGLRIESGSRAHAGETAHRDAPVVERLRRAGAIVLGTTNVPEMLMGYESVNSLYGRTNNPWDVDRTPGGSSGGEAAAIASGCSAAGVGGDAAGSLRVPAHFTGICALKPTPGRIPATGHFPLLTGPMGILGVIGPMARCVADLRLLLEVTAGFDAADASSAPVPVAPAPDLRDASITIGTIGWFADDGVVPVTRETRAAVRSAIEALADAGLATEMYIPPEIPRAKELWSLFLGKFGQAQIVEAIEGENVGVPFLQALDSTKVMRDTITPHSLARAWMERDDLRARLLKGMDRYPVVVCPVAAVPAFRHGEREWKIDGCTVGYVDAMSYSVWPNIMGNPAVVVPAGRSSEGLPIGVQVVARPWEEPLALAVAALIEERLGAGG